jgi:hypothetical protein
LLAAALREEAERPDEDFAVVEARLEEDFARLDDDLARLDADLARLDDDLARLDDLAFEPDLLLALLLLVPLRFCAMRHSLCVALSERRTIARTWPRRGRGRTA